ncbi:uncharacterized protein LOC122301607 [Carya illinoinensis]|uniref:uncharacterized protein LOC122301607 n=1 Tax=Carya illinoinensis TaxID=32201 RepID=UPI001C729430|nr:uncharacterized protein LOC122301607 [Carya illinoinensis]
MICLSWNYRGLRNPRTIHELLQLVKTKTPHLVFLIETKCSSEKMETIRVQMGSDNCFAVKSVGRSGGLALLWNSSIEVKVDTYTNWHISVYVKLPNSDKSWLLTGFYGHPNTAKRSETWQILKAIKPAPQVSWMCFGDFNEITCLSEKYRAAIRPYKQVRDFRQTLAQCELSDFGFRGDKYTWANNREGSNFTKERLDRVLGNSSWIDMFEDHSVQHLATYSSDHKPLLITLQTKNIRPRKKRIFRYEDKWRTKEGCEALIKRSWKYIRGSLDNIGSTLQSLRNYKTSLNQWSKDQNKKDQEALESKVKLLNHLKDQNVGQHYAEIRAIQKTVDQLLD